jgi:bifunctional enzyme CysN/CysC
MYEAADRGEIAGFPGVSAEYDRPTDMDLQLDTSQQDVEQCVDRIVAVMQARGFLRG